MDGPGVGIVSGIALLRTLRANHRLKAKIAAATAPMKPRVLHGVANIEESIDVISVVDEPFLILWSRLRFVEVRCSASVTASLMSLVTWTVVYAQG